MADLAPCTFYEDEDNIEQIHVLCVQYAGTSLSSEKCLPGYGRGECIPDLQPYKHLCTLKWREVLSDTLPVKISGSQLPYALQDSTVFMFDTIAKYLNYMITKCQAAEHFVNYYMIVQWYEHALVTKGAQYPAFFEALKATGNARLLFESETNEWWEAKELMRLRETLCFQKKVTNMLVSKPTSWPPLPSLSSSSNLVTTQEKTNDDELEEMDFQCCTTSDSD